MDRGSVPPLTQLQITRAQLDEMHAHLEACLPNEGCGLLAGNGGVVSHVLPAANADASPVRFHLEPREQLRLLDWIDRQGLELLAIFHSHPSGPRGPSPTDVAEAAYPVVHIIFSHIGDHWAESAFWISAGRISDVELYVAGEP